MPARTEFKVDFLQTPNKEKTMNKCINVSVMAITTMVASVAEAKSAEVEYFAAAQVYDLTITAKTTQAQRGKLKKNHPFDSSTDAVVYRKQTTRKWTGVIWGCECESIMGVWGTVGDKNQVAGAVIWDTKKPYSILLLDDMHWHVLNAFDKTGDKVEGAWTIGESTDGSGAFLSFAGFGTLNVRYTTNPCEDPELNCGSYVKTMSGNVAGWMPAPSLTTLGKTGRCTFCGDVIEEGEDDTVDMAVAWNYCPCMDFDSVELTAVSGSWTLKYNVSLSNALLEEESILSVYKKFPDNVKLAIAEKIAEINGK